MLNGNRLDCKDFSQSLAINFEIRGCEMLRALVSLFLIIMISLVIFKALDNNAGAQGETDLTQVLENQRIILEKLDVIGAKVDGLKTRLY